LSKETEESFDRVPESSPEVGTPLELDGVVVSPLLPPDEGTGGGSLTGPPAATG